VIVTDAWVLHAGRLGEADQPGELLRETIRIPDPTDDEAVVEPILGSWEGNMSHAITRSPVDVCRQRGERFVVLGNSGVARVLRPAASAVGPAEGEICLCLSLGTREPGSRDRHGYSARIYAYDAPGTYGLLAKRTKIPADLLLPIPHGSRFPLERWTPCLRYFTAWDNWRVALACWRAQLAESNPGDHLVFGWGGGVTLAQLILARREGFRTAMMAASNDRIDFITRQGITAIDRREYPGLGEVDTPDTTRWASERRFLSHLSELAETRGVSIFLDHIGGALYPLTLRALSREAVLTTCGWKAGMELSTVRSSECIRRHIHVHTHGWRHADSTVIRDFQEATGWLADIDPNGIYRYDEIPQLATDYTAGKISTYFPVYRISDAAQ
jgi:NADPH:quinone reductase-like Zn-dependent oxidoreductase